MKKVVGLFISIILVYWAIKPILLPGFFPVHDDTQPSRVYEMAQGLKSGQFPVRWVGDLGYGYGYPLFNFYAPLPYYIGAAFNTAGVNSINSTKIMYALGILAAAVFMYFIGWEIAGLYGGITGAVLYTYAPYHAVDIYIRGAVGEYYAMAFLPLLSLGIIKVFKSQIKSGVSLASLGLAGILLSHNILGMITLYFMILLMLLTGIYYLISKKNLSLIICLISLIGLGLGLSAFFTVPAFMEKEYTKVQELTGGGSNFHDHFLFIDQLWNSPWGYGGSAPGRSDGMSFKIGKIHLLMGMFTIILIFYLYKEKKADQTLIVHLSSVVCLFLISSFFTLGQSQFLWDLLPGFSFIQYPWRFLSFTVFFLSVISTFFFAGLKWHLNFLTAALLVALILVTNVKYFQPREISPLTERDYIDSDVLRRQISSISDEYMPPDFSRIYSPDTDKNETAQAGIYPESEMNVTRISDNWTDKRYILESPYERLIVSTSAYFPGWTVFVDNLETAVGNTQGRNSFILPAGKHTVKLQLKETVVQKIANAISIFSLFLLVYVSFVRKRWLW